MIVSTILSGVKLKYYTCLFNKFLITYSNFFLKKISKKFPINFGYGAGFSYVLGKPKIEQPFNTPLLSEVKAEISHDINKDSQIVFALHHRCTFFGLLTPNDGESFGQHWYTIGYRYGF